MEAHLERLTDKLNIYQYTEGFRYGTDSVLLAWFAAKKPAQKVCDLCAGNGAVGFLYAARRSSAAVTMLELLPHQAELARRSVAVNGLEDRISVFCGDVRDTATILARSSFDAVTVNPPYMTKKSGFDAAGDKRSARAENECVFADVAAAAGYLLRYGGEFYCIIKSERLTDAFCALRENGIEPKRLMLVQASSEKPPYAALIEAKKNGAAGLKTDIPLIIRSDGGYTDILKGIYSL